LSLSNSIRVSALAETEIELIELPNEKPTLFSLEEISGVGKVKNDLEHLLIPEKSRFDPTLRRMALAIESSSVVAAPSGPTP
jgi:ribosomal protein S13